MTLRRSGRTDCCSSRESMWKFVLPRQWRQDQPSSEMSCSGSPRQPSQSRPPSLCIGRPREGTDIKRLVSSWGVIWRPVQIQDTMHLLLEFPGSAARHSFGMCIHGPATDKKLLQMWCAEQKSVWKVRDLSKAPPRKEPATGIMSLPVFFPFPPKPSVLWVKMVWKS